VRLCRLSGLGARHVWVRLGLGCTSLPWRWLLLLDRATEHKIGLEARRILPFPFLGRDLLHLLLFGRDLRLTATAVALSALGDAAGSVSSRNIADLAGNTRDGRNALPRRTVRSCRRLLCRRSVAGRCCG